jgi:hypothetical protein
MNRHLAALGAGPRFVGTDGNARARAYCVHMLRDLGYRVEERPFTFSALPGLYGAQLLGAWIAMTLLVSWWLFSLDRQLWAALAIPLSLAWGLALAHFARRARGPAGILERTGVNTAAWRGPRMPRVWLVAHIDSKRQPVSILVRAAAMTVAVAATVVAFSLFFIPRFAPDGLSVVLQVAYGIGIVATTPLLLSTVGDGSDGAADNASGVAAVLTAVERLRDEDRVGIAITDAEELALAGARALTGTHLGTREILLNCDTIDDEGEFTVMKVRGASGGTVDAMRAALTEAGVEARVIRLLPGILTDSVAFAAAGHDSVTLSRGSLATLGRLHTGRDTLAQLRGSAIDTAGAALAAAARRLA